LLVRVLNDLRSRAPRGKAVFFARIAQQHGAARAKMAQLLKRVRSRSSKSGGKQRAALPSPSADECGVGAEQVLSLASPHLAWNWPLSMRQHFSATLDYQSALVVHDAAIDIRMFVFATVMEHVLTQRARLVATHGEAARALVQVVAPNRMLAQRACLSVLFALNFKHLRDTQALHGAKKTTECLLFESAPGARPHFTIDVCFVAPSAVERQPPCANSLVVLGADTLFANSYFVRGVLEPRLAVADHDAHVSAFFAVSAAVAASASFAYRLHPRVFVPITESHGADERKYGRFAHSALSCADVRVYADLVCVPSAHSRIDPNGGARERSNTITLGIKPMVRAPQPPPDALSPRARAARTARSALLSPRRAAPQPPPAAAHPQLPPTPSPGCSVPSTSSDGESESASDTRAPSPPLPATLSPIHLVAPLTRPRQRPTTIYVDEDERARTLPPLYNATIEQS